MEKMSHKYFNNSWEPDLDYILFDVVVEWPSMIGDRRADPLELRELANLFEIAGGIWTGDSDGLRFVDWEGWKQISGLTWRVC
jgi:hypothetical protein